jgi:hypothetical protein
MYRADAIVTGTDMRQRPWGFAQTLREVLVKLSGDPRLKDDPRTARLAAHADRFVACFDYVDMLAAVPLHDDQGTSDRSHKLTVYFIPAEIDVLLARFGDKPWRGERPVVVPVLLVHGRNPPPYVLSAEIQAGEEQRGSFATAADQFGMDVRIRARRGFSLGVRTPVIFRAIRHHRAPARPSSSVRSTGARRCRGGLENGGCSGTAPITDGASAASITTRHFVTSSAESCWLLREPVRPTKGIEPPGRRRFVTP